MDNERLELSIVADSIDPQGAPSENAAPATAQRTPDSGGRATASERISGSGSGAPLFVGDRLPHLAMSPGTAHAVGGRLIHVAPDVATSIGSANALAKIGTDRRCGPDGFCDPSSKLGCGGEFCGKLP